MSRIGENAARTTIVGHPIEVRLKPPMGGLRFPSELAKCQLVHEIGMNTTWERWFSMMELPYPRTRGPGYSFGSMSIEARSGAKA